MNIELLLLRAPPILLALTVHEYAHGWVADKYGDPTARYAGRLTLNPLSHLDPIGTLMLFIAHIGWAKPVPVDPRNLRNPKRDMLWISLAGPGANVLLAFLVGLLFRTVPLWPHSFQSVFLIEMLWFTVFINLALAFFNLIPVPPLDGSKILMALLPPAQEYKFRSLERYGFLIIVAITFMGRVFHVPIFGTIIGIPAQILTRIFSG